MDLKKLNSATKYPSIETYHTLAERGKLTEEVSEFSGNVVLTEKVDGTNARIILVPGHDYFIGSREELLFAKGDRVSPQKPPEAKSIVDALKDMADQVTRNDDMITTLYLEVYGGKIGRNYQQYSAVGAVGYRLFDVSMVSVDTLRSDIGTIASWRDSGGQPFLDEEYLVATSSALGVPLVPRLSAMHSQNLPTGIEETYKWIGEYLDETGVSLDEKATRRPEGIVIRDAYRNVIRKARFQDYERTLGIRSK